LLEKALKLVGGKRPVGLKPDGLETVTQMMRLSGLVKQMMVVVGRRIQSIDQIPTD
jgi:hypothetical protein